MSANRHLAPGVDTKLLKTHFSVVTDEVGALRLPLKSNKFPPTVNWVRYFSSFLGFTSHTILPYVTFLIFWALCFGNENNCICPFHIYYTMG